MRNGNLVAHGTEDEYLNFERAFARWRDAEVRGILADNPNAADLDNPYNDASVPDSPHSPTGLRLHAFRDRIRIEAWHWERRTVYDTVELPIPSGAWGSPT